MSIYRNTFVFSPPSCPSVSCAPSEKQINDQSATTQRTSVTDEVTANEVQQLYLPRPAMPPSSLGSKDEEEEERCENAELRSEAVWTGIVVVAAAATMGAGGCGLRSPVRLSKGTGVIDAEVTSPVLTWGFTWFLSQRGKGEDELVNIKLKILLRHNRNQCFLSSLQSV